jgi:hypothetical protein
MQLSALIQPEIRLVSPVCFAEATHLIKQLECAELAIDRFLTCSISFRDLLDILELCEVDIDEYLFTLDSNLREVGII